MRNVTIHAYTSVKGGVGKSSLAVVTAQLLSSRGRGVVLVDVDLTGTSIADAILMRAPNLSTTPDGKLDFSSNPTSMTCEETDRGRERRWTAGPGTSVPFINDALLFAPEEPIRAESLLWTLRDQPSVRVIPSSSASVDVAVALAWLQREDSFRWKDALKRVLEAVITQCQDITDLVLDLPPGLFGFAQASLILLREAFDSTWNIDGVALRAAPRLVLSPDLTDLCPGIRDYRRLRGQLPPLRIVVNRWSETRKALQDALSRSYPELELPQTAYVVPELPSSLGTIFRVGDRLPPNVCDIDALTGTLGLLGKGDP